MQFVSRVFWDTKLELGNSNWIPVICALTIMRTIGLIANYRLPMSFLEFGVLAPDERH
jgi:hypothetical protein|tara:strand:- start:266 stop:439 length:174 start_codon:yes stop_codon:yes gene_type:complete